jgi:hypothetical protein
MHYCGDVKYGTYQRRILKNFKAVTTPLSGEYKKKCWNQVREQRIKNSHVRKLFFNIPNIEAFIERRTARFIGKVIIGNVPSKSGSK